jgi:hypothetical protein
MRVRELLTEGGWASTVTQGVKLTPDTAKKAVSMLPKFEREVNAHLKKQGLPPLEIGDPVGSTAYIEQDLKSNPDKEYGDIDVIVRLPSLPDMTERQSVSTFEKAIADFIINHTPPYVYPAENNTGSNVIVKTDAGWVQVDLIKSPMDDDGWAQYRSTPEHNLKGALIGYLYSAAADTLDLSMGTVGVQMKVKGGEVVKFRTLKADQVHTISKNITTFALDTAKFLVTHIDPSIKDVKIDPLLKKYPGLRKEEIKAQDLANAIKGLARTLELNGVLGKRWLKGFSSAQDVIAQVKATYLSKAEEATKATKFDKASTPDAIKKAAETKETLLTKSKEVAKYLD